MRRVLLMSDNSGNGWVQTLFEKPDYVLFQISGQLLSLDEAEHIEPDLIFWDIVGMNLSCYKFAQHLRRHPLLRSVPLIIISDKYDYTDRIHALKSGADLLIPDTFVPEELLAVSEALIDQSNRLQQRLIMLISQERKVRTVNLSPLGFPVVLTPKEKHVLEHIATGNHNKEIAAALSVSIRTVESHVTNILNKTGLMNRTQLARWAMEHCELSSTSKSLISPFSLA